MNRGRPASAWRTKPIKPVLHEYRPYRHRRHVARVRSCGPAWSAVILAAIESLMDVVRQTTNHLLRTSREGGLAVSVLDRTRK